MKLHNRSHILAMGFMASAIALLVAACGGGGGGGSTGSSTGTNALVNGQAAVAVIGQSSFTASTVQPVSASSVYSPVGNVTVDSATGKLYVPDPNDSRVLVFSGIPTSNGASAQYALGQNSVTGSSSGTSASSVASPQGTFAYGGKLFVADPGNNRVAIYSPMPTGGPGTIATVLGETSKTASIGGCASNLLSGPYDVSVAGGKIVVADTSNSRVLIWTSIPTSDGITANLALGQTGTTTCTTPTTPTASSILSPTGVWTDGTRLVVTDMNDNRVLIWNTFPTASNQVADIVLGQANFSNKGSATSQSGMWAPFGVTVDAKGRLFIADSANNRVLEWDTFPTKNAQPADHVLGQINFTSAVAATSQTGMYSPEGVYTYGNHVLVTDMKNNRILVY